MWFAWRQMLDCIIMFSAQDQAPVPEKTISANRGLNPANRGIKFVLRLDCVPQNTISTIPGIK